ncbi:hypothetical protein DM82_6207 [Burkholderia oklahomensis]|uniref:Uncharacterized protein n=1 Tax=Burkholderia oklahomensis TaxID=342113 RepID=A0AAI8BF47_9BURK|nr:hypothetical protein DM82_6207 [Burkholderia oklahomensis]AJX34122.1 hypothetical protein BG90_4458 [Burkholderia oklahomensis C6786]SUY27766.1 Uncharacterised protein [Burkholderia oklahomensis]
MSSCAIRRFVSMTESTEASLPAMSIVDETRVGAIIDGLPLWLLVWNANCCIEIGER